MNAGSHSAPLPRAVRLRRVGGAAAVFFVLAAALYLKTVPCLFALLFRTPCPACGSTRAVVALLHGEVGETVHLNPFAPFAAIVLGLFGLQALASLFAHGDLRDFGRGRAARIVTRVAIGLAVLQTLFWLARLFGAFGGPVPV